jgi:arylsulfatase A-like enzyme
MNKPNILFIFADQLRYSALACNGNRIVRTPNFDRLAKEGVVFDNAFSGCPICSPYRGQILTGRYSHINGVICNEYRLYWQTSPSDGDVGFRTSLHQFALAPNRSIEG